MKFEDSETLQCLINAFAGESQAANKYAFYSKIAKKEGHELISQVFLETASNEKEHAKLFFDKIPNGLYEPNISYPFFCGTTSENLISSASAEREEWENIYRHASQTAQAEGFDDIAGLFSRIVEIEKRHSHRFAILADELEKSTLYKKSEITQWICTECGHTHIGKEAPCKCPVCSHPQGYFRQFSEKY